jgi:hypothetical protein
LPHALQWVKLESKEQSQNARLYSTTSYAHFTVRIKAKVELKSNIFIGVIIEINSKALD